MPLFSRMPISNGVLSLCEGVRVVEEHSSSGLVKEEVGTERSSATMLGSSSPEGTVGRLSSESSD